MEKSEFRIDLGQGDYIELSLEGKEKPSLQNLLDQIKKAKVWVVFKNSAIQVSHIKRIEQRS